MKFCKQRSNEVKAIAQGFGRPAMAATIVACALMVANPASAQNTGGDAIVRWAETAEQVGDLLVDRGQSIGKSVNVFAAVAETEGRARQMVARRDYSLAAVAYVGMPVVRPVALGAIALSGAGAPSVGIVAGGFEVADHWAKSQVGMNEFQRSQAAAQEAAAREAQRASLERRERLAREGQADALRFAVPIQRQQIADMRSLLDQTRAQDQQLIRRMTDLNRSQASFVDQMRRQVEDMRRFNAETRERQSRQPNASTAISPQPSMRSVAAAQAPRSVGGLRTESETPGPDRRIGGLANNPTLARLRTEFAKPENNVRATERTAAAPVVEERQRVGIPQAYRQELAEQARVRRENEAARQAALRQGWENMNAAQRRADPNSDPDNPCRLDYNRMGALPQECYTPQERSSISGWACRQHDGTLVDRGDGYALVHFGRRPNYYCPQWIFIEDARARVPAPKAPRCNITPECCRDAMQIMGTDLEGAARLCGGAPLKALRGLGP